MQRGPLFALIAGKLALLALLVLLGLWVWASV